MLVVKSIPKGVIRTKAFFCFVLDILHYKTVPMNYFLECVENKRILVKINSRGKNVSVKKGLRFKGIVTRDLMRKKRPSNGFIGR
jgi:hypothetical protein